VLRQWSGTLGRMRFQLRFPAPACLLLLRRRIPTPAAVQMLLQMLLQMLQILRQTILLTACSPFHPNDATARPRGSAMMRARCITGDHRHWLAGKASLHSPPPNAACRRFFIGYDSAQNTHAPRHGLSFAETLAIKHAKTPRCSCPRAQAGRTR
jgi:hypothetical protein